MAKTPAIPATNAPESAATWEPIDSLTPWGKNPRKNDGEPVDRVAKSIERFGFASPIVARSSDRVIIAGHTRWKAAKKLGMDKVPVRFVDLDPDQAAALALADNRLTEITPWDDAGLADVLRDLEAASVDLDGLGWDDTGLASLMGAMVPEAADPFGILPTDEPTHEQMTFTLSHDQADEVRAAVARAKALGPFVDTGNENSNGNALARVCEMFHA
jgi:ParB-like chromosome segregation protein Spo0J